MAQTRTITGMVRSSMLCSEDGRHTYMVRKQFPERDGNKAMVIQLYPTLTAEDINTTDTTMLHFLNHLDDLQLKEVTFVNLFSKVCKARPSTKALAVDEVNLEQIKKLMQEKDFADCKVIVAWGSSMEKNTIATEMKRRIIQMYKEIVPDGILWQLTADDIYMKNESAVHALFMGIRHKNSVWKLEKFQIPEALMQTEPPKRGKGRPKKTESENIPTEPTRITTFPVKERVAGEVQKDDKQEVGTDV